MRHRHYRQDSQYAEGPCEQSEDGYHLIYGGVCRYCEKPVREDDPREYLDDDGVDYADPRDFMEERLLRD
jgi:hypothetical protein